MDIMTVDWQVMPLHLAFAYRKNVPTIDFRYVCTRVRQYCKHFPLKLSCKCFNSILFLYRNSGISDSINFSTELIHKMLRNYDWRCQSGPSVQPMSHTSPLWFIDRWKCGSRKCFSVFNFLIFAKATSSFCLISMRSCNPLNFASFYLTSPSRQP